MLLRLLNKTSLYKCYPFLLAFFAERKNGRKGEKKLKDKHMVFRLQDVEAERAENLSRIRHDKSKA